MSVREYIGARYVPVFADPTAWDNTKTYEPLTIVLYQGNSYTSKQYVPAGIDIGNANYWSQTGNYNAQVEAYRNEVQQFDNRITQNADDISDEVLARQNADSSLSDDISNEVLARQNADTALGNRITKLENRYCVWIGDSYSTPQYAHGSQMQPYVEVPKRLGVICKSYASAGAGWLRGGDNNFGGQITQAIQDTSYPHQNVDYVFIFGGQNDVYQMGAQSDWTVATMRTRMGAGLDAAKNEFANAQIIVIGVNTASTFRAPSSVTSTYTSNAWNDVACSEIWQQVCDTRGVAFIDTTMANVLMSSHFDAGDSHPNDDGYKELTAYIMSGLNGRRLHSRARFAIKAPNSTLLSAYSQYDIVSGFAYEIPSTVTIAGHTSLNLNAGQNFAVIEDGNMRGNVTFNVTAQSGNANRIIITFPNNIVSKPTMYGGMFTPMTNRNQDTIGDVSVAPHVNNNVCDGIIVTLPDAFTTAYTVSVDFNIPII